ncbi:MAG TPA: GNAT family N-acetyltransferase [Streptosporangiaceae bacterium]|jgi:predicted GNAT family acetyltransferase
MAWTLTQDVGEYLAAAGDMLRSQPAQNTLMLTIAESLRARGGHAFGEADPLFGWWDEAGGVTAALLQTPPFPAVITPMPEQAATALTEVLVSRDWDPRGVNGPVGTAQGFAAAWQARTGRGASVQRRSRLFRLAGFEPPAGVPGRARTPESADRDLLVAWFDAFVTEVGDVHERVEKMVDDKLSYGGLFLWEDGGQPVSLAARNREVAGQIRIGPVYTPPQQRGRGYGGAVTAAVTQAALHAGAAEVLLFTDLANPTSNALYQRLGYRPLSDFLVLKFTKAGS